MARRVAVVTGASSGIGREVARGLVAQRWRVIGTGRDRGRIAAAQAELGADAELLAADLSLIAGADRLAEEIAARTDRVDLLVNNAGGMTDRLAMTAEGLEANFAGNHLGPMRLTERLLPLLRTAAKDRPAGAVRILMTSSDASEMIPGIDLNDPQGLNAWSTGRAYCTGKLANVLFAKGLARRLAADGIVAHAVHPGAVDSNFFSYAPPETQERTKGIAKQDLQGGADTLLWLATCAQGGATSGGYWFERAPRAPNPLAEDRAFVERFWEASERLIVEHTA